MSRGTVRTVKVGRQFKRRLEELGLKQYMVAAELQAAGLRVKPTQLSRMLNEQIDLPLEVFVFLAKLVGEPPSAFLGEDNAIPVQIRHKLRELLAVLPQLFPSEPFVSPADASRMVPLLRVAATPDNETYVEDEPRTCEVPVEFHTRQVQAYEVVGNSMRGDDIHSGDIVYARPPRNEVDVYNEIVVALVNNYRHLKRLRHRRGRIHLVSSAPGHETWTFDPDSTSCRILGIVIGRAGRIAR